MTAFALSDRFWSLTLAAWLLLMIVIGGVSNPSPSMVGVQAVASIVMLAAALWRLRQGFPGRLAVAGAVLGILCFALVALQLVPLPPAIWQNLPGRSMVVETAKLAGGSVDSWRPMSLTPDLTKLCLIALLPGFATFLAVFTLDRRDAPVIGLALVLAAIAGVSLFAGGIGVMNIMLVSVTERVREIGIRKALGASRRDILFQFLIEASALSLSGGGVGVGLGVLVVLIANTVIVGLEPSWVGTYSALGQSTRSAKDSVIRLVEVSSGTISLLPQLNAALPNSWPTWSKDGKLLSFSSTRSGGKGSADIYYAPVDQDTGVDQPAVNMSNVNTSDYDHISRWSFLPPP